MKKIFILIAITTLMACNKNTPQTDETTTETTKVEKLYDYEVEERVKEEDSIRDLTKIVPDYFEINQEAFKEFKKDNPYFYGDITSLDTYNGYALSVISPLKNQTHHSSALMRYVLHFLLIVEGLGDS